MRYKYNRTTNKLYKKLTKLALILVALVPLALVVAVIIYILDLQPVSDSQRTYRVTIQTGSSVKQIAAELKQDKLIRSDLIFQIYSHLNNESSKLEAGIYALSPSQTIPEIFHILTTGRVATKLVTILPGKTIAQISASFVKDGFSTTSVSQALTPSLYSNLPVLAFKPANVNTLEGLLWPDSFQKTSNTDPTVIIRESLNEMASHLSPAVQQAFSHEGLSTYQGLILTSIIQQEVSQPSAQAQVAQVFLSRLKDNMRLGSDVTAYYGSVIANQPPSLTYNSPYNTLLNKGLPPTPIATISSSSLYAATHPANTNWLYFVTGDNGVTYFSTTLAQHQQQTAEYCHKLCSQ